MEVTYRMTLLTTTEASLPAELLYEIAVSGNTAILPEIVRWPNEARDRIGYLKGRAVRIRVSPTDREKLARRTRWDGGRQRP
jgi:hypothetical protein